MKLLIAAAGTGGHIFPGLAIAKKLQQNISNIEIHWVGTIAGLEYKLVPQHNLKLHTISISGVRGTKLLNWIYLPVKLTYALLQSLILLIKLKPKLVIGMGGFVAGPVGIAAWLLRIPLVIHEQNAIAGTTNKILAKIANQVFSAFPDAFPKAVKATTIGNPLREEFGLFTNKILNKTISNPVNILVLGGSRGALALNLIVPKALSLLQHKYAVNFKVKHQTGLNKLVACEKLYIQQQVCAEVIAFIDDMLACYYWADLVICRSGALTIAEITAMGLPSILIPFPFAIDDHQTKNAQYLAAANAAVLLPQHNLTPEQLAEQLYKLLSSENLLAMSKKSYDLAKIQATEKLINQILGFFKK